MKFQLTDGRKWYKQVVSGVFKGAYISMWLIVVSFIAYVAYDLFPLINWKGNIVLEYLRGIGFFTLMIFGTIIMMVIIRLAVNGVELVYNWCLTKD